MHKKSTKIIWIIGLSSCLLSCSSWHERAYHPEQSQNNQSITYPKGVQPVDPEQYYSIPALPTQDIKRPPPITPPNLETSGEVPKRS